MMLSYKKHTLRLWLPTRHPSVTLVPLVSWLGEPVGARGMDPLWLTNHFIATAFGTSARGLLRLPAPGKGLS